MSTAPQSLRPCPAVRPGLVQLTHVPRDKLTPAALHQRRAHYVHGASPGGVGQTAAGVAAGLFVWAAAFAPAVEARTEERSGYVMLERQSIERLLTREFVAGLSDLSNEELTSLLEETLSSKRPDAAVMLDAVLAPGQRARQAEPLLPAPPPAQQAPQQQQQQPKLLPPLSGSGSSGSASFGSGPFGSGPSRAPGRSTVSEEAGPGPTGDVRGRSNGAVPQASAAIPSQQQPGPTPPQSADLSASTPEKALAGRPSGAADASAATQPEDVGQSSDPVDGDGPERDFTRELLMRLMNPSSVPSDSQPSPPPAVESQPAPLSSAAAPAPASSPSASTAIASPNDDNGGGVLGPALAAAAGALSGLASGLPDLPSLPSMPSMPSPPALPELPSLPRLPSPPSLQFPSLPSVPSLPAVPDLPSLSDAASGMAAVVAGALQGVARGWEDSGVGDVLGEVLVPIALVGLGTAGVVAISTLLEDDEAQGQEQQAAGQGEAQVPAEGTTQGQAAMAAAATPAASTAAERPAAEQSAAQSSVAAAQQPAGPSGQPVTAQQPEGAEVAAAGFFARLLLGPAAWVASLGARGDVEPAQQAGSSDVKESNKASSSRDSMAPGSASAPSSTPATPATSVAAAPQAASAAVAKGSSKPVGRPGATPSPLGEQRLQSLLDNGPPLTLPLPMGPTVRPAPAPAQEGPEAGPDGAADGSAGGAGPILWQRREEPAAINGDGAGPSGQGQGQILWRREEGPAWGQRPARMPPPPPPPPSPPPVLPSGSARRAATREGGAAPAVGRGVGLVGARGPSAAVGAGALGAVAGRAAVGAEQGAAGTDLFATPPDPWGTTDGPAAAAAAAAAGTGTLAVTGVGRGAEPGNGRGGGMEGASAGADGPGTASPWDAPKT